MLSHEYFEERQAEIARWQSKGYLELAELLSGTNFTLDDLVEMGVLVRNEPLVSVDIRTYLPAGAWVESFQKGSHQTCFLPHEQRDVLLAALEARRLGR